MAKQSFEEAMARLEKITRELEAGDLSLELSLKKFDEGVKLAGFCNQRLGEAESKVALLLDRNGVPGPQFLSPAATETETDPEQ